MFPSLLVSMGFCLNHSLWMLVSAKVPHSGPPVLLRISYLSSTAGPSSRFAPWCHSPLFALILKCPFLLFRTHLGSSSYHSRIQSASHPFQNFIPRYRTPFLFVAPTTYNHPVFRSRVNKLKLTWIFPTHIPFIVYLIIMGFTPFTIIYFMQ